jgi:hypothetical protein
VLAEAIGGAPARVDLYVILVERPRDERYDALLECAVKLSKTTMADPGVRSRVRRIAWIDGFESGPGSLAFEQIDTASA